MVCNNYDLSPPPPPSNNELQAKHDCKNSAENMRRKTGHKVLRNAVIKGN